VTEKHFIVATAGHVDHGKSALVKALTGADTDRLPEEKAREITIDLGFAGLNLTSLDGIKIHVGVIDVPGHEDFVRNMIAGVGSIDLALLVVAVNDGWMPQTEEHLQILVYLGVKRMVVALNKSDLGRVEQVSVEIKQRLQGTPYQDARIVPTSTRSGEGIEQLKQILAAELGRADLPGDIGKPRLFVDRTFSLPGIGAVVTGTLSGGTLASGQTVYLQPGNFETRIRSIQSHHSSLPSARPGMRTALNLADVPKTTSGQPVRRGHVVTSEEFTAETAIDVVLQKSERLHAGDPAARPLKSGTSVHLHYGTTRLPAMLFLAKDEPLHVGECAIAQLRSRSPLVAFVGDRFVLRDQSEQHTIAGGIVLDPDASRKSFRTAQQQNLLRARATAPNDVNICVESEIGRHGLTLVSSLLQKSNFSPSEVEAALKRLQKDGRIIVAGEIAANNESWEKLRNRTAQVIERAHKTNSERAGLNLNDLRAALPDLSPEVFEALVNDLCAADFVRRGSIVARVSHRATLPPHLGAAADNLLKTLLQKPFDPPGRKQLAPDPSAQQVLAYLIEQGEAVELGSDIVMSEEAFTRAKKIISQFIAQKGAATVSELRQSLQTSRRVIVPLLERLDRDRLTQRVGDQRTLIEKL
jgi:selenocysteine-specific elongation factor